MKERFNHLLHYANDSEECRSRIIEQYFCDTISEPCGICDNCLARKRKAKAMQNGSYEKKISEILANESLTIKELVARIVGNENSIVESVRQLIDKGIIICEGTKLRLKN